MTAETRALARPDLPAVLTRAADARVVELVRDGDGAAFEEVCRRHRPLLLRLGMRMLNDAHLAEDVVQESLWRAHRALLCSRAPIVLKPWLCQITRNRALDELARRRSHGHLRLSDEHPALDNDPADVMGRKATVHELLSDLVDLPHTQRHALLGRACGGVPHQQLADELNITTGASRSLVHRARSTLATAAHTRQIGCAASVLV